MREMLGINTLLRSLQTTIPKIKDHRKPSPNTKYSIFDAVLGAFGIFFLQCESLLEYQRQLNSRKGRDNTQTLFGVMKIPTDAQIRNILDLINPSVLFEVFIKIYHLLKSQGILQQFEVLGVTLLGDDLYSRQPMCEVAIQQGFHYIFVCLPQSHETWYDWLNYLAANGEVKSWQERRRHGRDWHLSNYRWVNRIPLRDAQPALETNWLELIITRQSDGQMLFQNNWITDHLINPENIVELACAGRARWKTENEHHNILKTKGYHLEHNFGHGSEYLASVLVTLNLLAFLFHTVLHLVDVNYQQVRQQLGTRKRFFHDLRTLTTYFVFDSWQHLISFMLDEFEPLRTANSS